MAWLIEGFLQAYLRFANLDFDESNFIYPSNEIGGEKCRSCGDRTCCERKLSQGTLRGGQERCAGWKCEALTCCSTL